MFRRCVRSRFPAAPSRAAAGGVAGAALSAGAFLAPAPRKPPPPPPAFRSALDRDFLTVDLRKDSIEYFSPFPIILSWPSILTTVYEFNATKSNSRPQAAAATDEVVPVVPPADPPERAHLSALQGQEPLAESEEAQEEIVTGAVIAFAV
ncbi:unnamed protein product [Euphydryas editha]|uniref:Uncharacterized protein n=1 Tax=Euphydryas editha TaxID=104508 RepID=A0AAU9TDF5_EUPED|nr:unnamed protein product [Euphydryas editha]